MKAFFLPSIGRHRRRLVVHLSVLLAVGVAFAVLALTPPFTSYQRQFADLLFLPEAASSNVVIVAIDDATLDALGRFQEWPRSHHGDLVQALSQAQARVIGFDVLLTDISVDDAALAQAMVDAGNVITPVAGDYRLPGEPGYVYARFFWPTTPIRDASLAVGHAVIIVDDDNVIRRIPVLASDAAGHTYASFSLAALYAYYPPHQAPPQGLEVRNGQMVLFPGTPYQRAVPLDASGAMRVNYTGGPRNFQVLSYLDVLQGNFDPALVRNKIVLVGMMETSGIDTWSTPVTSQMAGVEIHANAIDTVMRGRFLNEAASSTTALTIIALAIITALSLPRLNLRFGGLLVVVMMMAYVMVSFVAFDRGHILNFLYPPVGLLLAYIANIGCRISAERADKRQVKDLFGKYVSPQVADEIIKMSDADRLRLGGERREVTVVFTDIRGFTQISTRHQPEQVIEMLNHYFTGIIARIEANQGMVNKFAGDNIMAVWNAPQKQPDHAYLAVKAAIESQQAIRELQQKDPSLLKVQFGFGINTGQAIAGNVGSEGRLEYTVIGDAVNLASRICGAAAGGKVWISEHTWAAVQAHGIHAHQLEAQQFKGMSEPLPVYEVEE